MKILYAVQATGNGHISRAKDVIPLLEKHGYVDVFLSGTNSQLNPGFEVKYRSKGLSLFYNKKGGLNYAGIIQNVNPLRIYKEAQQLPVNNYDLVVNDFEFITSLACKLKKKPSVQFGHQASYLSSKVPRPSKKDVVGEFVLKHYAEATHYTGLHFWPYDKNIFTPLLRNTVLNAKTSNQGHITVYLNQYSLALQRAKFGEFKNQIFHIFSHEVKSPTVHENLHLKPIDKALFTESMIHCHGVITGAGFETPAEALILNKKLMVIPILAQYEQLCNAEALKEWNVSILEHLKDLNSPLFTQWYEEIKMKDFQLLSNNQDIVDSMIDSAFSGY